MDREIIKYKNIVSVISIIMLLLAIPAILALWILYFIEMGSNCQRNIFNLGSL